MILEVDFTRRVLDAAQGLTLLGVASLITMILGLRDRVKGIETRLERFPEVESRGEHHGVQLATHEVRLDGHDREIGHIRKDQATYPAPTRTAQERAR